MIQLKMKKNFDFKRLTRNVKASSSVFLNDLAKPIKQDWDARIKRSVPPRLSETTKDLHGSHIPLNLTGKLAKSNKILPASTRKLKATIKNTAKSTKTYKIRKPNGKIYKGTRKSAPVFYGYWLNKGFITAPNSLVPGREVPARDFSSVDMAFFKRTQEFKRAKTKFLNNLKKSMRMASK